MYQRSSVSSVIQTEFLNIIYEYKDITASMF
jgi:hypothetical protein